MTDVMDDVRAAMTALESGEAPAEPVTNEAPQDEATPGIEASEGEEKAPVEAEEGRKRGPDGKFVAKTDETGQDNAEQPAKVETPQESIRPPASWSAAAKSKFAALDPDVQKEVLRREREVDQGFRERAEQIKRYEPLEQILAPRRDLWAAQGLDEAQAIKTLLAAQDLLERNPQQGLEFLAKSYGVSLTAQPQGQPQQAQPGTDSLPEIQTLKQQLAALQEQVQTAQTAPVVSQIEAFSQDPANLYFENVRPQMAALLKAGQATDLKDAYEKACWMNPEIRPLLQTPQVKPNGDAERAKKAKAAGASVTGSPTTADTSFKSSGSVEDDIRAALIEVSGQA